MSTVTQPQLLRTYVLDRQARRDVSEPPLRPAEELMIAGWDGPLLVTGGPGSGKTTLVVQAAVAAACAGDAPPPLVLTWSRAAASSLRNRISSAGPHTASQPRVATVHSLCRGLIQRYGSGSAQRLLTAPEQEFRVRELLSGRGAGRWPAHLALAVGTAEFARQVRAVLARARQLGLDPGDLVAIGAEAGRDEWVSAGEFFAEYLDVLDQEGVLDYAELVHRSRILLAEPEVAAELAGAIGSLVIDEYGELDPAQIGLVRAMVPAGGRVLATGDPLQTVNSFRGAHRRALTEFPALFPRADGSPAEVFRLTGSHRFGAQIGSALAQLGSRLPHAPGPGAERGSFADRPGAVRAITWPDEAQQASGIAAILRQAHLFDGVDFSEAAVLVRSGRRHIGPIVTALTAAGVPVEVSGDEMPLASTLAVRPLLLALEVLARGHAEPDEALRLAASPIGGLEAIGLRNLARQWHALHSEAASERLATPAEIVAEAINGPDGAGCLPSSPETQRLSELVRALARARAAVTSGMPVDRVLWELWQGTSWPRRLQQDSLRSGDVGRRADRDLDALCALFEAAADADRRGGVAGIRRFLAEVSAQQIPADHAREAAVRGRGVQVMTVHRAKGRQWPLVVVAGVQEGVWPATRRAPGVLEPEELVSVGLAGRSDHREWLADERRLFYVACSRAQRRLVVTATAGTEGQADQPSRFLSELGVPLQSERPASEPLTIAALVAELRRASVDPEASAELREAAAVSLARLADAVDADGVSLAAGADPVTWWGTRPLSSRPCREEARIRLSPSQIASLLSCPRRYFLERPANALGAPGPGAELGSVIHALVERARTDEIGLDVLTGHLDRIWHSIPFAASWVSVAERVEAELALTRFLLWEQSAESWEAVGVEVPFEVELSFDGVAVTVSGAVDRLERARDGRLRVVDLKTARALPSKADVTGMTQLGVYQLAIEAGAFAKVAPGRSAGAQAVYLRHGEGATSDMPRRFDQPALSEQPYVGDDPQERAYPTWVHHRIASAAAIVAEGRFEATAGGHCRTCAFAGSCPSSDRGRQVVR